MTLLAASGAAALLPILIVLACPLVMILMMRGGMHGHHHQSEPPARGPMTLEELKRERDALNEEIGRRAEEGGPEPPLKNGETMSTITYSVPDISCGHCSSAITAEVTQVAGVEAVEVDLDAKTITISGAPLDEQALVAAIDDAGYEVAR